MTPAAEVAAEVVLPLRATPVHLVGTILASQVGTLASVPCEAVMTATGITFRLVPERGEARMLALDFADLLAAVKSLLEQEQADRLARIERSLAR